MKSTTLESSRSPILRGAAISTVIMLTLLASSASASSLGGQAGLMLGTLVGIAVWMALITLPITSVAWFVSCIGKQKGIASQVFRVSCVASVVGVALMQFAGLAR